jgi:patatin-related protein
MASASEPVATAPLHPLGGIDDPGIKRQLRLAVTMNGGVSLAVYIGGVAHEFNRLTKDCPDYSGLLDLLGYGTLPPIIDVITGTSAGGINAAALALAQANGKGDLSQLRGLWIQHGQIGDLLRGPFRSGPPSLLKGDDYFYPQIRSAFQQLTKHFVRAKSASSDTQPEQQTAGVRPVDLTITATLLTPVDNFSVDDLGTEMVQPEHAGLFYFRGGTSGTVCGGEQQDMFGTSTEPGGKPEIDTTVEALALAARATAGFPVAFEPTFVPVHYEGALPDDRPDMACYANWVDGGGDATSGKDLSRYAVDGGILANTPTKPALAAIRRQEVSSTLVRRVLILVHPHAVYAGDVTNQADNIEKPPTLAGGLAGVLRASSSVGSKSYVEEIQHHNDLALRWRDGREAAMIQFSSDSLSQFLYEDNAPGPSWDLFRGMRLRRAAYVSANRIRKDFATPFAKLIDYASAVLKQADHPTDGLPFLPKRPPTRAEFENDEWRWGLDLAVGIASQATELARQLISEQNDIPEWIRSDIEEKAKAAWKAAVNGGIELDHLGQPEQTGRTTTGDPTSQDDDDSPEIDVIRTRLTNNLHEYRTRKCPPGSSCNTRPSTSQSAASSHNEPTVLNKLRNWMSPTPSTSLPAGHAESRATADTVTAHTMRTLRGIAIELLNVITMLDGANEQNEVIDRPRVGASAGQGVHNTSASLLETGNPLRGADNREELLKRMLEVEIVSYLVAEHNVADAMVPTAPIEFVQLSARLSQHFVEDFTSDDKLAGMSLNRFGAFLKRSWRANDWIWGRLDAVKIIMLVLLTPAMIRGLSRHDSGNSALSAEQVVEKLANEVFDENRHIYRDLTEDGKELSTLHKAAQKDVTRALNGDSTPLTNLASLMAYGIQLKAAKEDVPWLAGTIRDDQEDGAIGTATAQFVHRFDQLKSPNGYTLLKLFAESRIGREALAEQLPSDLMIRTAATAAATAATALSSEGSGLGFARPATKFLRGAIAVPYWVLTGLTHKGQVARALATMLLALGVGLTALALIADPPGLLGKLVPTIGIASLATVLVYASMRTQSMAHGAALLGVFIPLIAYAVHRIANDNDSNTDLGEPTVAVICVILLLLWVVVVANIRPHTRSPLGTLQRVFDADNLSIFVYYLEIIGLITATVVYNADLISNWYRDSRLSQFVSTVWAEFRSVFWHGDIFSWVIILLIVAAVAGCVIAYIKSRRFRPSRRSGLPRRARIGDPAGLATAWSPVYGIVYIALGIFLVPIVGADAPWARVASILSILFGLGFSLIAVNLIPYLRERKLVRKLTAHLEASEVSTEPDEIIKALNKIGDFSTYLTTGDEHDKLSRHGERVQRRAQRAAQRKQQSRESSNA